MFRIVGAERARALNGELLTVNSRIVPDNMALMDVVNPLVRVQLLQHLRRAVAGGGQSYHSHVAYSSSNHRGDGKLANVDRDIDPLLDKVDVTAEDPKFDGDGR
ncbi:MULTISPECIES: hypothetical protein [Rhizobium]|uniref:Uncharacterized protein n=1 Tax=Rhizobium rhododendri TaxID=2506430 RepID=A0ABY8INL4_9HYPH|nr:MULTISPECIES: hypothetical protein [Rhizobium]WFS25020.1 hypothetical protein PR018_22285 [Rhizobium rhododendri]